MLLVLKLGGDLVSDLLKLEVEVQEVDLFIVHGGGGHVWRIWLLDIIVKPSRINFFCKLIGASEVALCGVKLPTSCFKKKKPPSKENGNDIEVLEE
jgi:hypothetical protein